MRQYLTDEIFDGVILLSETKEEDNKTVQAIPEAVKQQEMVTEDSSQAETRESKDTSEVLF